jgi:glycine/D-amino acid oxidase-like deaminating enzyme
MKPLFHPSLYQFDQAQPSYWEASAGQPPASYQALKGDHSCDVAIIGGGYTGLSAALHLARDFNVDVCLLEAGHIGWGASGRNGGFCAMGMTKLSLESQLKKFGAEQTRAFHQSQAEAVNLVRALGEDEDIDFLPQGRRRNRTRAARSRYQRAPARRVSRDRLRLAAPARRGRASPVFRATPASLRAWAGGGSAEARRANPPA